MRKIVLDANVLVSGVIASGHSASILDAIRREEIRLVTSTLLLEEFSDVMHAVALLANTLRPLKTLKSCSIFYVPLPSLRQVFPNHTPSARIATMISFWPAPWMKRWIVLCRAIRIC
jgi:predicted nucleic acid-binding protein